MKVKAVEKLETEEYKHQNVYLVTFEPTWFERKFLKKTETTGKFKDNDATYVFGSGHVYIDQRGHELGNGSTIGKAIDAWRRKW